MALQDQVVPIHFGQGINSKTDPKLVPAGQVLQLQDAVFTEIDACNKRNGYNKITKNILGGGILSASPSMISELNDELVCADNGQLYAYEEALGVWLNRGPYVPFKTTIYPVSRINLDSVVATSPAIALNAAYLGDYALFAWGQTAGAGNRSAFASIMDLTNNKYILSEQLIQSPQGGNGLSAPPFVLANTSLAMMVSNSSSHPAIAIATINSSAVSIASPVQVNTDTIASGQTARHATGTATGAVIGYFTSTTTLKVVLLDNTGAQSATATISGTGFEFTLRLYVDPTNGNIWVFWVDSTSLKYRIYDSSLSTVLTSTTIETNADFANLTLMIAVQSSSVTSKVIFYGFSSTSFTTPVPSSPESPYLTKTVTINSTGVVGSVSIFKKETVPMSDVFTINGISYIASLYASSTQACVFTYRTSDGALVAKTLWGNATTAPTTGPASVVNVKALSSYKVAIPVLSNSGITLTGTNPAIRLPSFMTLDGASIDLFQTAVANNNLVMNGGQIYSYDNLTVTELQFHIAPQTISTVNTASGASPAAGTYIYYTTYLWIDNNGNIYESAPSIASTITTSGGSVTVYYTLPFVTNKTGIRVRIYRTLTNGTIAHLVTTTAVDTTAYYGSFEDTFSDASITANPTLYTAAGAVLDNNSPPPGTSMLVKNNRLWVLSDEAKNEVWYSKTFVTTGGINFSLDLLEDIDVSGNQITAIAGMDEKIIYFNDVGLYYTVGDGANDTGNGSTLSLPQTIPADTGCSQSSGLITFPTGVMAKTPKGIYQLDRALNFQYFGAAVERYNNQTIKAANIIKTRSQIRFLCSDGVCLVYDYILNKWAVFTNHRGLSATVWKGAYTYLRTDGQIYKEIEGYYLDDTTSYGVLIQTAWLDFAGVQGFQRAKEFLMLGDYVNGSSTSHGIQTSMMYDFQSTSTSTDPFYFSDASPYQYRTFLPQQKCDSVSITVQELVTGDSAEYITFTDMSLLAGVKKGFNKTKAAASVG